jgi:DNA modification methylase
LACFLNKRKFVGVDMENDYLELSIKRLKELKDKISKKQ